MIAHDYVNSSDNLAQWFADQIGRVEVSYDWYWNNVPFTIYAWVGDESIKMGLDPWRVDPDVETCEAKGWRLFIDKSTANEFDYETKAINT